MWTKSGSIGISQSGRREVIKAAILIIVDVSEISTIIGIATG
jgi:hypothetical protein